MILELLSSWASSLFERAPRTSETNPSLVPFLVLLPETLSELPSSPDRKLGTSLLLALSLGSLGSRFVECFGWKRRTFGELVPARWIGRRRTLPSIVRE